LIFCSSSALLGTPFQPCSIFGCATFAFTAGGFAVGGAFASVPDLTAAVRLVAASRSIASR
jgi:hypothetical protein